MDRDVVDLTVGIAVIAAALSVLCVLVFWSHRAIERIARGRSGSAREIARTLGGEEEDGER